MRYAAPNPGGTLPEASRAATGRGQHLVCLRRREDESLFCAGLALEFGTVLAAVLKTQFGPSEMFVVRNDYGEPVETFAVPD